MRPCCECGAELGPGEAHRDLSHAAQEDFDMTKDQFRDKYGDEPRKDDLTILAPKQAGIAVFARDWE